jgi:hypothetical protein
VADAHSPQPGTDVFALDEYAKATAQFFSDAVLAQIRVEHVEALPPSRNTLPSGEILEMPPAKAETTLLFSIPDGIDGIFDDVHVAVAQAAKDYAAQVVPHLLQQISNICDAVGNVVDGAGRSIWDAQLEMIKTISIVFDADGDPSLPSLVLHPTTRTRSEMPRPSL